MIDQILLELRDGLYCSKMLGGPPGVLRASQAVAKFENKLKEYASNGFSHEESYSLLKDIIALDSRAFLITLKITADFSAFSKLLDEFEPEMNRLSKDKTYGSLLRQLSFINTVLSADPRQFPNVEDFNRYKAMREVMKSRSHFGDPKIHIINAVIDEFEKKSQACPRQEQGKSLFSKLLMR